MYLSYEQRASETHNAAAVSLFRLMEQKETNLAVAADVTTQKELLTLADQLGPYICVLKTHVDILEDFDLSTITQLQALADKHGFLLFEDRKFADIGNTVQQQYQKGIYRIADWAHITNAHILPGAGIIRGLKEVGLPLQRGLLLLAQMSSAGTWIDPSYVNACVSMAKDHRDFVIGFITQNRLTEEPGFLHLTPGVHLSKAGDALGQQYQTPEAAILEKGSDIIIVGRGITHVEQQVKTAQEYRREGWNAYKHRLNKKLQTPQVKY